MRDRPTGRSAPLATVLRPGDLVYIDAFSGLIPARLVEVFDAGTPQAVLTITANRRAYRRGERVFCSRTQVVPRSHVRVRSGRYVIVGAWSFDA